MIRLGSVVLGAIDVEATVAFWHAVTGYRIHRFPDSENDFVILVPPDGEGTRIAVQRSDHPADPEPRVHLDFIVDSADEQRTEVQRLVDLGASQPEWNYPDVADFVVLADPDGNRFCVVDASFVAPGG